MLRERLPDNPGGRDQVLAADGSPQTAICMTKTVPAPGRKGLSPSTLPGHVLFGSAVGPPGVPEMAMATGMAGFILPWNNHRIIERESR